MKYTISMKQKSKDGNDVVNFVSVLYNMMVTFERNVL